MACGAVRGLQQLPVLHSSWPFWAAAFWAQLCTVPMAKQHQAAHGICARLWAGKTGRSAMAGWAELLLLLASEPSPHDCFARGWSTGQPGRVWEGSSLSVCPM